MRVEVVKGEHSMGNDARGLVINFEARTVKMAGIFKKGQDERGPLIERAGNAAGNRNEERRDGPLTEKVGNAAGNRNEERRDGPLIERIANAACNRK
jgi:hypothetical protein